MEGTEFEQCNIWEKLSNILEETGKMGKIPTEKIEENYKIQKNGFHAGIEQLTDNHGKKSEEKKICDHK